MRSRASLSFRVRRLAWLPLVIAAVTLPRTPALPADRREERMIGPGVKWQRWVRSAGPWVIHIVEADLSERFIEAAPVHAGPRVVAAAPISQQAVRVTHKDRYPIAMINGDYFAMESGLRGLPIGVVIRNGEIFHNPYPRSALILSPDERPRIAILQMQAQVAGPRNLRYPIDRINNPRGENHLVLYTPRHGTSTRTNERGVEVYLAPETITLTPGTDLKATVRAVQRRVGNAPISELGWVLSGSGRAANFLAKLQPGEEVTIRIDFTPAVGPRDEVIGGGPRLVRAGRVQVVNEANVFQAIGANQRHPRTAVGIRGQTLVLVTVDGRQPGYSVGMTLHELAALMVELGCEEALNLDGGGSTTMWVRGQVKNLPSDGRERAVANGLGIFSTAPLGPPARLVVQPQPILALAGAVVPLRVEAEDQYYNPVPLSPTEVQWRLEGELGHVDERGQLVLAATVKPPAGRKYVESRLRAQAGTATAEVPLKVYVEPPRLEVVPALARLLPGQQCELECRAYDEAGRPLAMPPGGIRWVCDPAVGQVDERGVLIAASKQAIGSVAVEIGATRATAQVTVGSVTRLLDDFEAGCDWKAATYPPEVEASLGVVGDGGSNGSRALSLRYDFTTTTRSRAAYAQTEKPLGNAFALRLSVFGDGTRVWLRARVRDAAGKTHVLDLARAIDWVDEWRDVAATLPPVARPPLTLESIYVVETRASHRVRGRILLDNLRAEYPPDLAALANRMPSP